MKAYVTIEIRGRVTLEVDVEETNGTPDVDDLKTKTIAAYDAANLGILDGPDADCDFDYVGYTTATGGYSDLY